jgi:AcrR family transcriptional regulator
MAIGVDGATARTARREVLLVEAARLFRARGYHGVGIDDIGAAAGITGPGVYRHFAGKQALLAALIEAVGEELLRGGRAAAATTATPRRALEAVVAFHVDFALDHPERLAVWAEEERHVPEPERRGLRRRRRLYLGEWHQRVAVLRPDLAAREVRAAVLAALGALHGVTLQDDGGLERVALAPLASRLALATLLSRRVPR